MAAYYNEIDPFAAAWLRELINAGHIAPGDVDTRSIVDVRPDDLRPYTQCHFFAGIGVWSYALRRAGWPDSRPVWTGSCPCQPFSSAGKGGGFDDERHLWPHWFHLISQCGPTAVFGEQVASKHADAWIDLVQADMEALGYAFGAVPFPSAGVGAPHIRDRTYWLADAGSGRFRGRHEHRSDLGSTGEVSGETREQRLWLDGGADGATVGLADVLRDGAGPVAGYRDLAESEVVGEHWRSSRAGLAVGLGGALGRLDDDDDDDDDDDARLEGQRGRHHAENGHGAGSVRPVAAAGELGGLADADGWNAGAERQQRSWQQRQQPENGGVGRNSGPGPTNSLWRDADWLYCRDGKWRPVEPRPQPMVDGSAESLGRLRTGDIQEAEFEVAEWALRYQTDPGKALLDLRQSLSARAQREWPVGGLPDIHSAPILLAFLRQLTEQGWAFSERLPGASAQIPEVELRMLRDRFEAARASCGRGLDEQHADEHPDPMCVLSSILARHAQAAWGVAHRTYATTGFPLATGAHARVGRLRGYGNAINAEAAVAFIEAATAHEIVDLDAERVRLTGVFA